MTKAVLTLKPAAGGVIQKNCGATGGEEGIDLETPLIIEATNTKDSIETFPAN